MYDVNFEKKSGAIAPILNLRLLVLYQVLLFVFWMLQVVLFQNQVNYFNDYAFKIRV